MPKKNVRLFILTISLLLFASVSWANAIEWIYPVEKTFAWDVVTKLSVDLDEDGELDPIPAGDKISYTVHRKNYNSGAEVLITETDFTSILLTFNLPGRYILGVGTRRYIDLNGDGVFDPTVDIDPETGTYVYTQSDPSWSDDATVVEGAPWGISLFSTTERVTGLR